MRIARVENTKIIETAILPDGSDPADYYHPDLAWLTVPDDLPVEQGWHYENGDWTSPPLPTPQERQAELDDKQANAIARIKAEAERRIELVMPAWMVARQVSGGAEIPATIRQAAAAIRTRSDQLEAQVAGMDTEALDTFDATEETLWSEPPQEDIVP